MDLDVQGLQILNTPKNQLQLCKQNLIELSKLKVNNAFSANKVIYFNIKFCYVLKNGKYTIITPKTKTTGNNIPTHNETMCFNATLDDNSAGITTAKISKIPIENTPYLRY